MIVPGERGPENSFAEVARWERRHRERSGTTVRPERHRNLSPQDGWATFILDGTGRITDCSIGFAGVLGFGSPDGAVGRMLRDFLLAPAEYGNLAVLARTVGRVLPHRSTLLRSDGRPLRVVMSLRREGGGNGVLGRLVEVGESPYAAAPARTRVERPG